MPPGARFRKEEIVRAAFELASEKGIASVTAREVAGRLKVSVGPIFTCFESMDELRADVYDMARSHYREYIERGLTEKTPFRGIWRQYLTFAMEEPNLYRMLFLTPPGDISGGAAENLKFSQDLVRASVMDVYGMDGHTADCFIRNIWLAAFSYATMIVTGECPCGLEEMLDVGAEISLALCRAYRDIPGLARGEYDRDAAFRELTGHHPDKQ